LNFIIKPINLHYISRSFSLSLYVLIFSLNKSFCCQNYYSTHRIKCYTNRKKMSYYICHFCVYEKKTTWHLRECHLISLCENKPKTTVVIKWNNKNPNILNVLLLYATLDLSTQYNFLLFCFTFFFYNCTEKEGKKSDCKCGRLISIM